MEWKKLGEENNMPTIIFFDNITDTRLASFRFKSEKERDEYFLKIQKRIEKIQGFNFDLGGKNE